MTNDEAKKAFMEKLPVVYNDVTYPTINALIYRRTETGIRIQCELVSPFANSLTIITPQQLRFPVDSKEQEKEYAQKN